MLFQHMPIEGTVIFLIRHFPEATAADRQLTRESLLTSIQDQVPDHTPVVLTALGMYDEVVVVRSNEFEQSLELPASCCAKKVQPVFALSDRTRPLALFDSAWLARKPLVGLSFLRLSHRLLLTYGSTIIPELEGRAYEVGGPDTGLLGSLGWSDLIAIKCASSPEELDRHVPNGICNLTLADLPEAAACLEDSAFVVQAGQRGVRDLSPMDPVFSRSFTLVAVPEYLRDPNHWPVTFSGGFVEAHARVCAKATSGRLIADMARRLPGCVTTCYTKKGYEDLVVTIRPEPPNQRVPFAPFLRAYLTEFVPHVAQATFSTKLDLLSEAPNQTPCLAEVDLAALRIKEPARFLDAVSARPDGTDIIRPLRRMLWACNRALQNRTVFPYVLDVALHIRSICEYLDAIAASGEPIEEGLCEVVLTEAQLIANALQHRHHGSYYDLFEDQASSAFETAGGTQTMFLALWALTWRLAHAYLGDRRVFGCWVVGPTVGPLAFLSFRHQVYVLPASMSFALERSLFSVFHEICHSFLHTQFPTNAAFDEFLLAGYEGQEPLLQADGTWDNPRDWQLLTRRLLQDVACDALALWGPMLGNVNAALSQLVAGWRAMPQDRTEFVAIFLRAAALCALRDVYPETLGATAGATPRTVARVVALDQPLMALATDWDEIGQIIQGRVPALTGDADFARVWHQVGEDAASLLWRSDAVLEAFHRVVAGVPACLSERLHASLRLPEHRELRQMLERLYAIAGAALAPGDDADALRTERWTCLRMLEDMAQDAVIPQARELLASPDPLPY